MLPNSSSSTSSSSSSTEKLHIPPGGEKPLCVVCGEFTDGQHFGKFSCRACAAFFRRTVAHNLKYICKFNQNCEISKDVRNFCRFCRYRKCVAAGMITDAVQSHRDTYGKRNLPTLDDSPPKISKDNTTFLSDPDASYIPQGDIKSISYPQFLTTSAAVPSSSSNSTTTTSATSFSLFPDKTYPSLELLQPDHHFTSHSTQQHTNMLKHLPKMVEGYHKFRSLKKASFSLFMDEPRFINSDVIPESTYSNNKKSCQVESSLAYDMIMEYFEPFSQLSLDDRNKLFENFQGLISCGEKGYNTCRAYGKVENNDRLIMSDGGYVQLGELSKYYANSAEVSGDPDEVARLFGTSIAYAVKIVIPAMIKADLDDHILVALYGLCLFQEGICGISDEAKNIALKIKDELLKDLYYYYRTKKLSDEELNFKMSKTLLLIPQFENTLFENFQGLLSCGEKGCNKCRAYGKNENNDRLIMSDGGYVQLGELSKYYANSAEISGDPDKVARLFGTSIAHAVKTVIPAMVKADLDDHILVALYGLCLFQEGVWEISDETKKTALKIKD